MKKRLLISSVLMSAVLACALGTGTYAWYQATDAGKTIAAAAKSGNIGTYTKEYSAGGGFTITPVIGSVANDIALTDTEGKTYYYVGSALKEDTAQDLKKSASTSVGFTISFDGDLTDAQVNAAWIALGVTEITLTVEGSDRIKVADDQTTAEKTGEVVSFVFDVSAISFTSKGYTSASETVFYGVSNKIVDGNSVVEDENNEVGTISVSAADTTDVE